MQDNKSTKSKESTSSTVEIVKEALAEQIGVEPADIKLDDSFREDLHMSATSFADFIKSLENREISIDKIDLTEITTVGDLVDTLDSDALIE